MYDVGIKHTYLFQKMIYDIITIITVVIFAHFRKLCVRITLYDQSSFQRPNDQISLF